MACESSWCPICITGLIHGHLYERGGRRLWGRLAKDMEHVKDMCRDARRVPNVEGLLVCVLKNGAEGFLHLVGERMA